MHYVLLSADMVLSALLGQQKILIPIYRYETEALTFPRGSFPAPYSFFLATLLAMWDLISLTRGRTHAPASTEAQSLNHWTAKEVPHFSRKLAPENIKRAEPDSV